MEGVGARLGRSSNRYVPAAVFTGPVRKWKKKWVHVPPSSNSNHHHRHAAANGSSSHLLLYRWAPTQSEESSRNDGDGGDAKGSGGDGEPPKRKFKYIPIVVLEEQKNESSEQMEDETNKPSETDDTNTIEATSTRDGSEEKPDINDVPMDENQATENNLVERQDLNVSTLDLSLGLAHEGDNESDSKSN